MNQGHAAQQRLADEPGGAGEAYRTLMAAECEDHALVDDDSIAEVLTPTPESSHLVTYTPGPAWGPTHTRP